MAKVQDPTLGLVDPETSGLNPSTQTLHVPLQSIPALNLFSTPVQLGAIQKFSEGGFNLPIQTINKDISISLDKGLTIFE